MSTCNVCGHEFSQPLYVGPQDQSITSLCEVRPGRTVVYFCEQCGHLQSKPLPQIDEYYESQYRILLESDDEDQLYQIQNGQKTFRIDHQVRTFLEKVALPAGARILDYGCAKGASAKKLLQLRPDLSAHLFDVSSMYLPFWERFTDAAHWSTHELKPDWQGSFDAVMSYYVMEHVVDPVAILRQMADLLKADGVLYWLVPNVIANPADFIVADHVNHFSESSIEAAIQRAGLHFVEIDGRSHEAGWIVVAKNSASPATTSQDGLRGDPLQQQMAEMANYWTEIEHRIRAFESAPQHQGPAAIYGSGFYGTFVASRLEHFDRVECFVDQSPFRQGKTLLNKPIIAPEHLSNDIRTVYVGLNMRSARKAISEVTSWRDRRLTYLFL